MFKSYQWKFIYLMKTIQWRFTLHWKLLALCTHKQLEMAGGHEFIQGFAVHRWNKVDFLWFRNKKQATLSDYMVY